MWNWMTGNQKFLLIVLFFTTFFGGFVYLCYLAIAYRLERSSPVLGPQILQREAAAKAAEAARQATPAKVAFLAVGGLFAGAAGVIVLASISVAVDHHRSKPALTSQVTQAARP